MTDLDEKILQESYNKISAAAVTGMSEVRVFLAILDRMKSPRQSAPSMYPRRLFPLPQISQFPLPAFPFCCRCKRKSTDQLWLPERNVHGIECRRPYFVCSECDVRPWSNAERHVKTGYRPGMIAWNDARGVHRINPICDCGIPSRQDRSTNSGLGFWVCATGACQYLSDRIDGITKDEASELGLETTADDKFEAWLLPVILPTTRRHRGI